MNHRCWGLVLSGLMCLACGCRERPRAPALTDAPVYQNTQAGLRFLVPEGWLQTAAASLPSGALEREVLLTQYRMRTTVQGAMLEVLCMDERTPTDMQAYHAGPSHGVEHWQTAEPRTSLTIGGVPCERLIYRARVGDRDMVKEVVVFRRGSRVYSFVGLFWNEDANAREQLRRAVQSIMWTRDA